MQEEVAEQIKGILLPSLFSSPFLSSLCSSPSSLITTSINNKPLAGEKEHLRLRPREVGLQHKVCFFSFFFFLFSFSFCFLYF